MVQLYAADPKYVSGMIGILHENHRGADSAGTFGRGVGAGTA